MDQDFLDGKKTSSDQLYCNGDSLFYLTVDRPDTPPSLDASESEESSSEEEEDDEDDEDDDDDTGPSGTDTGPSGTDTAPTAKAEESSEQTSSQQASSGEIHISDFVSVVYSNKPPAAPLFSCSLSLAFFLFLPCLNK